MSKIEESIQDTIDSAVELLGKRVVIVWKTPEGEVCGVAGTLTNIRPSDTCPGTGKPRSQLLAVTDGCAEVPVEQVTGIQEQGDRSQEE